jgi:hypothetical protein
MTYRAHRRTLTSTFKVGKHVCKVFLEPWSEEEGISGVLWNVGFAVGRSRRQVNDWYYHRRNKRFRSLNKQMTGTEGLKPISKGFKEVLRLRWFIPEGDTIVIHCSSSDSAKQYKTFSRWRRWNPDWFVDEICEEFYWTKPII